MIWSGVSFLLCGVILLIGYELVLTPHCLHGKYNQSLCSNITLPEGPANRLVLFLVDSLKDRLVDQAWMSTFAKDFGRGIVIASRPLKRPGLVAIFSGHYEDVLKELPVFGSATAQDNIFLHVDNTFYFGPQVSLHFFKNSSEWISYTYTNNHLQLINNPEYGDDYVMDSLQEMFDKPKLNRMKQKNIFYIHLSSIDLIGHIARKGSDMLQKSVYKLGARIKKMTDFFEVYFNDSKTTYIVTSDHGMTDWGTHADNLPDEIRTPLIIWGNGAAIGNHQTLRQVDVCPLLAAFLGTPVPAESIGTFYEEYLNTTNTSLAYAYMCAAVQLADLCQTSWEKIDQGFLFKYFIPKSMTKRNYTRFIKHVTTLIYEENYLELIDVSKSLNNVSVRCLNNIQHFYRNSFLFVLAMSYFGWIVGTICVLINTASNHNELSTCAGKIILMITCIGYVVMTVCSIASVILEHLPNYYIVFIIIPSLAWLMSTLKTNVCLRRLVKMKPMKIMIYAITMLFMVEYTYWAKYLPYLFCLYLIPYSCILAAMNYVYVPRHVTAIWLITCAILILAPLVPLLGLPESAVLLNLSSVLWLVGSGLFGYALDLRAKECLIVVVLASIICLSMSVIDASYLGTYIVLKILAWIILFTPLIIVFASSNLAERLLEIVLSTVGPFQLLSMRHEPLVLLIFSLNLYSWLRLEASTPQYKGQTFVRGLTLHYYSILGVYAVGHIPRISSYDILWTRLFTSTFEELLVGGLILYKMILFLAVISCFFCATCLYIGKGLDQMILTAIIVSAISSARHSLSIIISEEPISALPEFALSNLLFISLIVPFSLASLLTKVKKYQIQ